MITVYRIRPDHGGFGLYQRDVDGYSFGELETVEDYISYVQQENGDVELLTEENEQVQDANGKTRGQNSGMIIGWKDNDNHVYLELVCTDLVG